MHLFTWNVRENIKMAPYVFAYLERISKSDLVIATLQEWPGGTPSFGNYRLKFVPLPGTTVLLYSSDLQLLDCAVDVSGRATIARFRLPSGSEITCVGIHWYSKDSKGGIVDACERGGAMTLFRHYLDVELKTPAILMGDFNSNAYDGDMKSRYCLFAQTALGRVAPAMEVVMGEEKRAWTLVDPERPAHIGTYFWNTTNEWVFLDHIVLTPELANRPHRAKVLTEMEGHSFLTDSKQVPRAESQASDHLPVVCEIHYQ
jgi:endonuclease/exonuclease/phosphatase family metal-dependent hydrolase